MSIRLLEDHVISQIAAGEVIERPASVVKELVENAIDAGASYIQVDIREGGQRLIRVSDNGSGIPAAEVVMAVTRHATSKLSSPDDLYAIRTLGFRGEALASIVAVSQTTLASRYRDESIGLQVRVEGGRLVSQKPMGVPAGTVITVENLFYNTPARLKFLKADSNERRQILALIQNYAMAYSHVRFVYTQDDQEAFRSPGTGQLADVLVKVLGLAMFRQMIEISGGEHLRHAGTEMRIDGFVGDPDLHRKDRTRITIFVNGRVIQDHTLTYAVTQAYHNLLAKGRYPVAVILIEVPPDFVDVNVHPTKAEVRFQDLNAVFAMVQRVIRDAVVGLAQTRASYFRPASYERSAPWFEAESETQEAVSRPISDVPVAHAPRGESPSADMPLQPRTLPPLRVIGQVGAAYIIAEGPAGLYLIDQHAAHTRLIYEALKAEYNKNERLTSRTIDTHVIDLSAAEARLIAEIMPILITMGLEVEAFGNNAFAVRSLPRDVTATVDDFFTQLLRRAQMPGVQIDEEAVLVEISHGAAVKIGQALSLPQMQELVRTLERCPSPLVSPDDEPTLIHISAEQLAREFGRRSS